MSNLDKIAIVIKQICSQTVPEKKTLQKLMYLIERKGLNLGLNYSIHFFGPYSSRLDNSLYILESFDKICINTSGAVHTICLGEADIDGTLDDGEQKVVDFVLKQFADKTARELEAITTLDYVATQLLKGNCDDKEIIQRVQQIKGAKFSIDYLTDSLNILKQSKYA